MWWKSSSILIAFVVIAISGNFSLTACPSADLTGNCFVDFEDFALMANQWPNVYDNNNVNTLATQWLTGYPNIPDDMTYIPDGEFEMGDHFAEGELDELPIHAVLLDAFFVGKYEITNQQYCDYLNSALGSGSIYLSDNVVYGNGNGQGYCDTSASSSYSQIFYSGGVFSVGTKDGRDMSDDPMVMVSWYGGAAYCNWRSAREGYQQCYDPCDPNWPCDFSKNGYRLATEAEWEYAARGGEQNPYYRFPWGDTISHSQANYHAIPNYIYDVSPTTGYHSLWNSVYPYTSPVGFFDGTVKYKANYNWPGSATSYQTTNGANDYGLYDMAGNVYEWCNDWYDSDYYETSQYDNPKGPASGSWRVLRGGCWASQASRCRITFRFAIHVPDYRSMGLGFRIALHLE